MLIDWFTVGAQALNFIILVALMKRFLYQPVLDAIDAREKRIAADVADADAKKTSAQRERDDLQHKSDAFDQQRAGLLTKATDDANAERQKLLDAACQTADALAVKRRDTMTADAKNLAEALRQRTQAEVFAIARKLMTELATASLEASACDVFVTRLRAIQGAPRDALVAALASPGDGVVVRSAFELPAAQRSAVQKAVEDGFGARPALRFETAPALVSGIELSAGGHKIAWSVDDALASLQRGVTDLLRPAETAPVPLKAAA